jgi:transcription factor TGA
VVAVYSLRQSSAQAEDALSQGMEKLQQTLSESLLATADPFAIPDAYNMGTSSAVVKLKGLVGFMQQVRSPLQAAVTSAPHIDCSMD